MNPWHGLGLGEKRQAHKGTLNALRLGAATSQSLCLFSSLNWSLFGSLITKFQVPDTADASNQDLVHLGQSAVRA